LGVGGAPDVGAFAVESPIHRCRETRDVIGKGECLLLSNEEPFHVDAPMPPCDPLKNVAVARAAKDSLPRKPQEESLGSGHLRAIETVKYDLGPYSLWVVCGEDHRMESQQLPIEAVLIPLGKRDVAVPTPDFDPDTVAMKRGDGVFQPQSELADDLRRIG